MVKCEAMLVSECALHRKLTSLALFLTASGDRSSDYKQVQRSASQCHFSVQHAGELPRSFYPSTDFGNKFASGVTFENRDKERQTNEEGRSAVGRQTAFMQQNQQEQHRVLGFE